MNVQHWPVAAKIALALGLCLACMGIVLGLVELFTANQ
jgi:hypothetical protein